MDIDNFQIIIAPLLAGIMVVLTHVPLGREVLKRGIIFIDLAIAQIAGLGVVVAQIMDVNLGGYGVQVSAGISALIGGTILLMTERRWPEIQEAIIGATFVLAASATMLILANHAHGAEYLHDLLLGQILWVRLDQLIPAAVLFGIVLLLWRFASSYIRGIGFYLVFSIAVTASVQLVGVYLVFASLIIPALAVKNLTGRRAEFVACIIGFLAYLSGLIVSLFANLPAAPLIVWSLACFSFLYYVYRVSMYKVSY